MVYLKQIPEHLLSCQKKASAAALWENAPFLKSYIFAKGKAESIILPSIKKGGMNEQF